MSKKKSTQKVKSSRQVVKLVNPITGRKVKKTVPVERLLDEEDMRILYRVLGFS